MFRNPLTKVLPIFKRRFVSSCDEDVPDLVEQADAAKEGEKPKITPPIFFENLKNVVTQGNVNAYDGFRVIVQKQVNLNTVVSHFYWLGSQATGQPIYQYRIIFPYDDGKSVNIATDMDFNVEGEVKFPVSQKANIKSNFVISEQQNNFNVDLDVLDESSATQFQYSRGADNTLGMSYMQSITPELTLGGSGQYSMKSQSLTTAFGGIYNHKEHTLAAQWDNNLRLLYLRKVNPNRVHLSTDLLVDEQGNSQMTLGAEYTLKQSKIHMSIDSGLLLKTSLETSAGPGVQLQFCAEMQQSKNHYRFGFGIVMG